MGDEVVAIGEVGLTGEIRSVSFMNQRISEVHRLGFKTCIAPRSARGKLQVPEGMELIEVKTLRDALSYAIGAKRKAREEMSN